MLTSLVLDALLILIILMMVPLGFLRGGLRELSTSAALLLGILMADHWAERWSGAFVSLFGMSVGAAHFTMAVVIVVVITGIVGYGGSAAFSWRPGPGGRMYGAYLALLNAMVFIGFLINTYIGTIFDGQVPETIELSYVSRAVSVGLEWVLLFGTVGVFAATLFGMLVRERGDDEIVEKMPMTEEMYHIRHEPSRPQVRPLNDPEETQQLPTVPHKPVRIREVRHWEEEPPSKTIDSSYGSGWRQTWPEDRGAPGKAPSQRAPSAHHPDPSKRPQPSSGNQRDVLRDWMRSERDRSGQED